MTEKPKVVSFWLDEPVADDDPLREVKLRARAHDAAAVVLGQAVHRAEVGVRAERLGEAASLFADGAFDPMETWDAGAAAGLTDADLDAASYVALVIRETELGR